MADKTITSWQSNNARVSVDQNGILLAIADALRPEGQAEVTASTGSHSDASKVTIVNWQANQSQLVPNSYLPNYILSKNESVLYGALSNWSLYSSTDGFITSTQLPNLPAFPAEPSMLFTPLGVFFRSTSAIYKSMDNLQTWTICVDGLKSCLYHAFDYYFDGTNVNIFTGEYTTDPSDRHKIIRGVIHPDGTETWETVFDFYSPNEYSINPVTNQPTARHVHAVIVDHSNGDVYAATGDTDAECCLMRSTNNGTNWITIGTGNQNWRALSIWFTTNYVYWNMDAIGVHQHIWRIARTNLPVQSVGNDLKTLVTELANGSHWYHCWGVDEIGRDVVIMSASPEGQFRDWMGRLFSIFENPSTGEVHVQELYAVSSSNPNQYMPYTQLEPKFQLGDTVYLRSRDAIVGGCWKMKFSGS
jgi:hypothetical protein